MDKKATHTPTPWREDSFYGIVDANGDNIAYYTTNDDGVHFVEGSKEKIIRAVNSHEDLLQTLKTVREFFIGQEVQGNYFNVPQGFGPDMGIMGFINHAIERAEGK